MTSRAPDLVVDLVGAAHPSRSARKEMRRFLAPRAIGLVQDAGVATAEVVRLAARQHPGTLTMSAWYEEDSRTLRVEVCCADPQLRNGGFPIVAALAAQWGAEPLDEGAVVWFEMHLTDAGDRQRGRIA